MQTSCIVVDTDQTIGQAKNDNGPPDNLQFNRVGEAIVTVAVVVLKARSLGNGVLAFNIPYLPMMDPSVRALRDTNKIRNYHDGMAGVGEDLEVEGTAFLLK